MFNARPETVAEKPMYRSAFKARRCIIPATGLYEWTGKAGEKIPHYFSAPDQRPLAFAGLWEQLKHTETGEMFASATIIEGPANQWMSRFSNYPRLAQRRRWMHGDNPGALLRVPPDDALQEWIVSTRFNRAGVDDDNEALILPDGMPGAAASSSL